MMCKLDAKAYFIDPFLEKKISQGYKIFKDQLLVLNPW